MRLLRRDRILHGGLVRGPQSKQKFDKHRGMLQVTRTDTSLAGNQ